MTETNNGMNQARIGIFLPRLSDYGGVERVAYRLAGLLAGAGYEVEFVCARVENEPPEGVTPVVVGRPGPFKWMKVAWYALAAEWVRWKKNYDLTIGLGEVLNMDLLRISGGPRKSFWPLSVRAYPKGIAREWKKWRRRLSPANHVSHCIRNMQASGNSRIATVSHLSRDWLTDAYPRLDPTAIRVVYNQPDLSRFQPPTPEQREASRKRFGMKDGEVAIVFAGTAFERKGLLPSIQAMAKLPENFRLYVAGGRKPGSFADLAGKLGVGNRVVFLGRVEDVQSLYHGADISLLPTFYDTCANVVPESLACGLKTIGSASDGSSFFLPERWIVRDPEDAGEIAAKVLAASKEDEAVHFSWPEEVECGLEPYLGMVREMLRDKGK